MFSGIISTSGSWCTLRNFLNLGGGVFTLGNLIHVFVSIALLSKNSDLTNSIDQIKPMIAIAVLSLVHSAYHFIHYCFNSFLQEKGMKILDHGINRFHWIGWIVNLILLIVNGTTLSTLNKLHSSTPQESSGLSQLQSLQVGNIVYLLFHFLFVTAVTPLKVFAC